MRYDLGAHGFVASVRFSPVLNQYVGRVFRVRDGVYVGDFMAPEGSDVEAVFLCDTKRMAEAGYAAPPNAKKPSTAEDATPRRALHLSFHGYTAKLADTREADEGLFKLTIFSPDGEIEAMWWVNDAEDAQQTFRQVVLYLERLKVKKAMMGARLPRPKAKDNPHQRTGSASTKAQTEYGKTAATVMPQVPLPAEATQSNSHQRYNGEDEVQMVGGIAMSYRGYTAMTGSMTTDEIGNITFHILAPGGDHLSDMMACSIQGMKDVFRRAVLRHEAQNWSQTGQSIPATKSDATVIDQAADTGSSVATGGTASSCTQKGMSQAEVIVKYKEAMESAKAMMQDPGVSKAVRAEAQQQYELFELGYKALLEVNQQKKE